MKTTHRRRQIVGTYQYMAPVQIEAKDADSRTDGLGRSIFEGLFDDSIDVRRVAS